MVAFSVFGFNIYWYGIFYLIGFIITYLFLYFLGKSNIINKYPRFQNFLKENLDDLMIVLVIGVLLGGRLGEVFIYEWDYFSQNPFEIIKVWHGGMSFFGGIIGVILSLLIFFLIKKMSWKDFLLFLDCIVIVLPIGIFLGRFGNFLNQELYGLVVPEGAWGLSEGLIKFFTNINIFHIYPNVDYFLRVNTNFISMFFEGLILFLIVLFVSIKQKNSGNIKIGLNSSTFLIFYSVFRFFIEYLRVDSQSQIVGVFTISQWIFLCLFILGIILNLFSRRNFNG